MRLKFFIVLNIFGLFFILSYSFLCLSCTAIAQDKTGQLALQNAVIEGDVEQTRKLIKEGYDPHQLYEDNSAFALSFYSKKNSLLIAKTLLRNGPGSANGGPPLFAQLVDIYNEQMRRQLSETGSLFRETIITEAEKDRRYKKLEADLKHFLNNFFQITQWLLSEKIDIDNKETRTGGRTHTTMYLFASELCLNNEPNEKIKTSPVSMLVKHGAGRVWFTKDDIAELNKEIKKFKGDPKEFACYRSLKEAFVKK